MLRIPQGFSSHSSMFISQNWPFNPAGWKNASKVFFPGWRKYKSVLDPTWIPIRNITIIIIEGEWFKENLQLLCQNRLDNCFSPRSRRPLIKSRRCSEVHSLFDELSPELHNPPGCYMLLLKAKEIKLPQNRKPNKREHQKPTCVCVFVRGLHLQRHPTEIAAPTCWTMTLEPSR